MPSAANVIRDIWAVNLEDEFAKIRELVLTHPYVAMVSLDTFNAL